MKNPRLAPTAVLFVLFCFLKQSANLNAASTELADLLLKESGFTGGFVVELVVSPAWLAAARQPEATQIQGLVREPERSQHFAKAFKRSVWQHCI